MTSSHPLVEKYLASVDASLTDLDFGERSEITQELRSHFAEAKTAGKPLDAVLRALGPADVLARAYCVELSLNPRRSSSPRLARFLRVAGVVSAASLVTLLVAGVLVSVGIGFTGSGLVVVAIGALEAAEIHLPGVETRGLPAVLIIVLGGLTTVIGNAALWALRAYVHALAQVLRRALPQRA
jgi:uncharacterized membrane protein